MPDPTLKNSVTGTSATSSTAASFGFTAVAGRLLVLAIGADDYNSSDPSGWTAPSGTKVGGTGNVGGTSAFLGHYLWYKIAAGGETSVTYTIGSASPSCWLVIELDNVGTFDLAAAGKYTTGSAASFTSNTITPTSGRRLLVATIAGTDGARALTGVGSWTNTFAEAADTRTNPGTGTQDEVGIAFTSVNGDGSTGFSATATFEGNSANSGASIIVAFTVASAASGSSYIGSGFHPGRGPTNARFWQPPRAIILQSFTQNVVANGTFSEEVFGNSTVTATAAVSGTSVPSSEVAGNSTVTASNTVTSQGTQTQEAFGNVTVTDSASVTSQGVNTQEALGNSATTATAATTSTGIGSSETFGNSTVSIVTAVFATGISSNEVLGNSVTSSSVSLPGTGISSQERLGNSSVSATVSTASTGIPTQEVIGNSTVNIVTAVFAVGIGSVERLGNSTITASVTITSPSVISAEVVGNSSAQPGTVTVSNKGITSSETLGNSIVSITQAVISIGIKSDEVVGNAVVSVITLIQDVEWSFGKITGGWKHGIPNSRWKLGVGMNDVRTVSALSLEYIRIPVAATVNGVTYNPTTDQVQFAFPVQGIPPLLGDLVIGSWETDTTRVPATYHARCLVGPGGTVTLIAGKYDIWVKITDSPEIVQTKVGVLVVY